MTYVVQYTNAIGESRSTTLPLKLKPQVGRKQAILKAMYRIFGNVEVQTIAVSRS